MGREIRRVPEGWEHPRKPNGDFQPMSDYTFADALDTWRGERPYYDSDADHEKDKPVDRGDYRPEWDTDPTHYQFYENVTEGTPLSPVFATEQELEDWLVESGTCNREQAKAFIKRGYVPTFRVIGGEMVGNYSGELAMKEGLE